VRTVDTSQISTPHRQLRLRQVIDLWGQSLSPGNEQREFWGSKASDTPGGRNSMGLKGPRDRPLVELVVAAPDRESLIARTRCLDRCAASGTEFVVPQFRSGKELVAYWNTFLAAREVGEIFTARLRYLVVRRGQGPRLTRQASPVNFAR
jgi:microcin C transport system substrate-binding protein